MAWDKGLVNNGGFCLSVGQGCFRKEEDGVPGRVMPGAGVQRASKGPCYLLVGKSLRLCGQHLLNAAEREKQVLAQGVCGGSREPP